jgi:hypothetical protein
MALVPLPLVAPCFRSRYAAGSSSLRYLEHDDPARVIEIKDLTHHQLESCSELNTLFRIDTATFLATHAGIPVLAKGVSFGYRMKAFNEDLTRYTQVCMARVSGNKIKFGYGSDEKIEERTECWEFCVKRVRIDVITKCKREDAVSFPLVLERPDETKCPVCYDDLSGNNISCDNKHQICLPCFDLLRGDGGQKKCPCCNTQTYSAERIEKYNLMNGRIVKESPYFFSSLTGGNSHQDFTFNEALFLGILKSECTRNGSFKPFQRMLMSSFYNFWIDDTRRFNKDFNVIHQGENNTRIYDPVHQDLGEAVNEYINEIDTPQIYRDVAYTSIYMGNYDDIDFYRELRDIDGNIYRVEDFPNGAKDVLRRETFFRYKVKHLNANELISEFKIIFTNILRCSKDNVYHFRNINDGI